MTALLVLALSAGGAALFRLRGSSSFQEWTGRGLTTIRLVWASYLAASAWAVDRGMPEPWWIWPLLLLALYAGSVPGWWRSLGVRNAWEVAKHSARGIAWVLPAALVVWWFDAGPWWPLIVAGALCGPIYLLNRLAWPTYAVQGGEWAFGAAIALALLGAVAAT